jgi:hypothetical protein
VVVARFTHRDHVGTNRLRLTAFVAARKLPAAIYRLQSVLLDSGGVTHTLYSALRIVTPPARHLSTHGALRGAGDVSVGGAIADLLRRLTWLL